LLAWAQVARNKKRRPNKPTAGAVWGAGAGARRQEKGQRMLLLADKAVETEPLV